MSSTQIHRESRAPGSSGPTHLIYPVAVPPTPEPDTLSVLSYNVLLPNSKDGWWTYKNYYPPVKQKDGKSDITSWEYRQILIKEKIETLGRPDVLCFQEVAPESFDDDFAFLSRDLGYDGVALYKKGRFRPATFWNTSKCTLVGEPIHRDRCFLTCFTINTANSNPENENQSVGASSGQRRPHSPFWHVLNCHLQAGQNGPRRLRQLEDGVSAIVKLERKLQLNLEKEKMLLEGSQGGKSKKKKHSNPVVQPNAIVCGDFNGGPECAAVRLAEDGEVSSDFQEEGVIVSTKGKSMPKEIGPLMDVAKAACDDNDNATFATLVVPEFISLMVEGGDGNRGEGYNNPQLSHETKSRLSNIFRSLATGPDGAMTYDDVKSWLSRINGQVGRGSEFRMAAKEMGWVPPDQQEDSEEESNPQIFLPPEGKLSLEGFFNVYQDELRQGKFWGIAHDMAILGNPIMPVDNPSELNLFKGRFDRMYCTTSTLRPTDVVSTASQKPCPNDIEPSDHLPVVARFKLIE